VRRGVDFDVAPGSIFAVLGSNGAGKTTVVRILSTVVKADGGPAQVNGSTLPPKLLMCANRSASRVSSPPSTPSSPDAKTWYWLPSCVTSTNRTEYRR
jgi:ABC-type multidrug transport system ATPase subunit